MKLHKNIILENDKGQNIKVDIEVYTRGGTKSDELWIIIYGGIRYYPYKARKLGFIYRTTFNSLFKMVYHDVIADLIPNSCSIFNSIPKDNTLGCPYHKPVILGCNK